MTADFRGNGYFKNKLIFDCAGEHTHAITTLLSNSLLLTRKTCKQTLSKTPRLAVYFHARMTSTLVSNPVTFISTTTSSLWFFSLMTSLSWTSAVTFILAAWRVLIIGRLPLVSIISKCSGFAECGRERKDSYLTWIRILGFLEHFSVAYRPFLRCRNSLVMVYECRKTLEYATNRKRVIYEFGSPNIRKKATKEYNDMLGLKWCNVKKIYKTFTMGYLYGHLGE